MASIALADYVDATTLAVPPRGVRAVGFGDVASRHAVDAWMLVLDRTCKGSPVDAYAVVD